MMWSYRNTSHQNVPERLRSRLALYNPVSIQLSLLRKPLADVSLHSMGPAGHDLASRTVFASLSSHSHSCCHLYPARNRATALKS